MSIKQELEIIVDWHPSGRYTLKEGQSGKYSDCKEAGLLGNDNPGKFYRAVAQRLANYAANGISFTYKDANYDN